MMIKGLNIVETYPYPDFEELEDNGLTHVFYSDTFLLNSHKTTINNIRELIKSMEGSNLELFIDLNAFKASDRSSLVDPTNIAHRNHLEESLIKLLMEIPEIAGLTFDDFQWGPWSGYHEEEQSKILSEFANQMARAIHELDPAKKLSASMNWTSKALGSVSNEMDFIIPKMFTTKVSDISLSKSIRKVLEETDGENVVVGLKTYDSAVNFIPRKISDIYNEISNVINIDGPNYCLYSHPWIPYGMGFPSKDYSFTQLNLELNLVSKHNVIPEKSSRIITVNFLDQVNNPISEDLLNTVVGKYKITDQSSGRVIKNFTSFVPDESIYKIDISGEDNRIVNRNVSQENHIITVSVVYGDGKIENEELTVTIQNLQGI